MTKPLGNSEDPRAIIVLPRPDSCQLSGEGLGFRIETLTKTLGEDLLDNYYITYLDKDPDVTSSGKVLKTDPNYYKTLADRLKNEISLIDSEVVLALGKPVRDALLPDLSSTPMRDQLNYNDPIKLVLDEDDETEANLYVCQDPSMFKDYSLSGAIYRSSLLRPFKRPTEEEVVYKILTFQEAKKELKNVLNLYREGKIEDFILDTETDSLLTAHANMLMVTFSYGLEDTGYCIPLNMNRLKPDLEEIDPELYQKWVDKVYIPSQESNWESIDSLESSAGVSNKLRHLSLDYPDLGEEYEYSAEEIQTIKKLLNKVLREVPISGHNLKYDIQILEKNGVISINDVKLAWDTMLIAFLIHGKASNMSMSLKDLSRVYLDVQEDWDKELDYYKSAFMSYFSTKKIEEKSVAWCEKVGFPKVVDPYNKLPHKYFMKNVGKGKKTVRGFQYGMYPTGLLAKYACLDVYYNKKLRNAILSEFPNSMKEIYSIMIGTTKVFAESELYGVKVCKDTSDKLYEYFNKVRDESYETLLGLQIVKNRIEEVAQAKVVKWESSLKNPPKPEAKLLKYNKEKDLVKILSDGNVAHIMYDEEYLGLDKLEQFETDTSKKKRNISPSDRSYSGGKDAREYFLGLYRENDEGEGAYLIHTYLHNVHLAKRMEKLLSTYFPDTDENGLYYTNFNMIGTVSGRLSSSFHTTDNNSDIKRLFNSRFENGIILAPDFSQLELRIAASVANDESMIEAYLKGIDIHKMTASKAFNVPLEDVTKDQRSSSKALNFGTLYGAGPKGLAEWMGKDSRDQSVLDEMEGLIDKFYDGYPGLKKMMDRSEKSIRKKGYITTMFGRRIDYPKGKDTSMKQSRKEAASQEAALRSGKNATIQSPASDIVLWSLFEIYKRIKAKGLKSIVFASIHDSIEVDCYQGELFEVLNIFRDVCEIEVEKAFDWIKCPMQIGTEIGKSWGASIECGIKEASDNRLLLEVEGFKCDVDEAVAYLNETGYQAKVLEIHSEREMSKKNSGYMIKGKVFQELELEISR